MEFKNEQLGLVFTIDDEKILGYDRRIDADTGIELYIFKMVDGSFIHVFPQKMDVISIIH